MSEKTRAYIYRVLAAGGAVALSYGLIDSNHLVADLGLAAVVFNVLPIKHTSTKE